MHGHPRRPERGLWATIERVRTDGLGCCHIHSRSLERAAGIHRPQVFADTSPKGSIMLKTYQGSCHCGAVRFEADIDLAQSTYRCNCSICRRTRFWPAVVKPDGFRLLAGEADLTRYLFNTMKNHHYFCKHCGVRAFGVGNETPVGRMYGVNIGCLEDVSDEELARVPITYVDGRNDLWQSAPAFFSHL